VFANVVDAYLQSGDCAAFILRLNDHRAPCILSTTRPECSQVG
jgi:hypothetical protein